MSEIRPDQSPDESEETLSSTTQLHQGVDSTTENKTKKRPDLLPDDCDKILSYTIHTYQGVDLPTELIEHILDYTNGRTLGNCRRVCSFWKSLIDSHCKHSQKRWATICRQEIPDNQFCYFLGKHNPKYWMKNSKTTNCYEIYRRWCNWQSFISKHIDLSVISGDKERNITCVKASGTWILYSTSSGHLIAYCTSTDTRKVLCRTGPIKSIYLKCATETDLVLANSPLPGLCHDEAVLDLAVQLTLRFRLHACTFRFLDNCTSPFLHYACHEDLEVTTIFSSDSTVVECNYINGLKTRERFDFHVRLMSIWKGIIILQNNQGMLLVIDTNFNVVEHPFHGLYLRDFNLFHLFIGIHAILIFKCDGSNCVVDVRVGNQNRKCVLQDIPKVCSALYYANHLFLGLNTGVLKILQVEIQDLIYLDEVDPSSKVSVNLCQCTENPILSIDILESHEKTSVIFCTSSRIYEISFNQMTNSNHGFFIKPVC